MKRILCLVSVLLLLGAGTLFAQRGATGKIAADLIEEINGIQSADELMRVIIVMNEQYDAQEAMRQTRYLDRTQKRNFVVGELQRLSAATQTGVLKDLDQGAKAQLVSDIRPLWIFNAVCCSMNRDMVYAIAERPDVKYVSADRKVRIPDGENKRDPLPDRATLQWNVTKVNADDVWNMGYTGQDVVVAVLDTGVNYNHTDIAANMWDGGSEYPNHGWDFVNEDNDPMDDHSHGTHCAGTVSSYGTNGKQCGIAKDAKIMALKVLNNAGAGYDSWILDAIQFAVDHGADVLSLSLGGGGGSFAYFRNAFEDVLAAGVVASVSAGNEGDDLGNFPVPYNIGAPGNCPPPWQNPDQTLTGGLSAVVTVGATTSDDERSYFSSIGPCTWAEGSYIGSYSDYPYTPNDPVNIGLIKPDIVAPGSDIVSLAYNNNTGYYTFSGTSMSTPCVAGIMALMLSANPNLTPAEIDEILETTAVNIQGQTSKNNYTGAGRVDALAAINASSPLPVFVKEVMLIGGSLSEVNAQKAIYRAQGWKVIDKDLNAGCGASSDYIYLLYKSELSENVNLGYVTDFYISNAGGTAPDSLTYGDRTYYLVPYDGGSHFKSKKGDLNSNAGGADIHLYFTKDYFPDNLAVSAITFNSTISGAVGVNGGTTGYDLNSGAGGEYIYMHLTTAEAVNPEFDISASSNPSGGGSLSGAGIYYYGHTCTLTATANTGYYFVNWTQNGQQVSNSPTYSFTVTGNRNLVANFEVVPVTEVVAAYYPNSSNPNSSSVKVSWTYPSPDVFNVNFDDSQMPSGWTVIDGGNPVGYGWCIASTKLGYTGFGHNGSTDYVLSQSYDNSYGIVHPDNWLISPAVTLGANSQFSLWACGQDANYVAEHFGVFVSTTGTNPSDFTMVGEWTLTAKGEGAPTKVTRSGNRAQGNWYQYTVDLGAYAGSARYIAIRHFNCSNNFFLDVDDIALTNGRDVPITYRIYRSKCNSGGSSLIASNVTGFEYIDSTWSNLATGNYKYGVCPPDGDTTDIVWSNCIEKSGGTTSYQISASANPSQGGTVSGAGTYNHGETCILRAIPAIDHAFVNWTKDGNVVATEDNFSFVVSAATAGSYVAHFESIALPPIPIETHWNISYSQYNMTIIGIVVLDGVSMMNNPLSQYLEIGAFVGDDCRGACLPEYHSQLNAYIYNMTIYSDQQVGEHVLFRLYNHITEEEIDVTCMTEVVFEAGEEIGNLMYPYGIEFETNPHCYITVTANPAQGGTVTGAGNYTYGETVDFTATPNTGYAFVNWTKDGTQVSTNAFYSFTVTEPGSYVANFSSTSSDITQSTHFNNGWTWWSTCIEQPEGNGLVQLEQGLGNSGLIIKKQTASLTNVGGDWYGTLYALDNASSYRIKTNAEVDVDITGPAVVPASHPVTLLPNWTWIGYPCAAAMSIDEAMSGITPTDMDVLKTQSGSATYMFGGWYGALGTLTPGMGLMYKSNSSGNITLTFPSGGAKGELRPNLTAENNHWQPNLSAYPDNMTVIAVVEFEEEELALRPFDGPQGPQAQGPGETYELAAFANGECRGSVRLLYVEPILRYIAFLTVAGSEAAELHFGLYNTETGEEYHNAAESLIYESNAVVGNLDAPYVIRFRGNTGLDDLSNRIQVFPNPVERGQTFNIGMTDVETGEAQVEIINALGVVVETRRATSLQAPTVSGVYTLRVTVEGQGTCYRKLIVR